MTMEKKFITIDLETGKKVLQTLEASFIKFSDDDNRLPGSPSDLDAALKAEITRALDAEKVLTQNLAKEVQDARNAEEAIRTLIGDFEENDSVKKAVDRLKALIDALTLTVNGHMTDDVKHITAEERNKWDKAVQDLTTKADQETTTQELAKKVDTAHLFSNEKIKSSLLPSIAVNSVTTVTSVAKAMALDIENGDVVIINPNAEEVKTKDAVITGTFICIDADKKVFEEKFRQLYSNTDYISKAEVSSLIKAEEDRATGIEQTLEQQIRTEKDENHSGSLANKIKDNKEAIAAETVARGEAIKTVTDKIAVINGGEEQDGSIAYAVKTEQTRAEEAEKELRDKISAAKLIIDKLDGTKDIEGSAAKLADTALQESKAHTDAEVKKVNSSADALKGRVTTLETTVGDAATGLVKDVTDLKTKVDVINGDDNTPGSINKALADAKSHANQQVETEKTLREQADVALDKRITSLEASEEFKVNLRFEGAEVSDVLAIRANGQIVKATLTDKDSSVVGIVVDANGANAKTAVMGRVGGFRNLVPGKSYFLGADGKITDIVPTEVGQSIIKIGVALTTTELFVNIQEAIEIRA